MVRTFTNESLSSMLWNGGEHSYCMECFAEPEQPYKLRSDAAVTGSRWAWHSAMALFFWISLKRSRVWVQNDVAHIIQKDGMPLNRASAFLPPQFSVFRVDTHWVGIKHLIPAGSKSQVPSDCLWDWMPLAGTFVWLAQCLQIRMWASL